MVRVHSSRNLSGDSRAGRNAPASTGDEARNMNLTGMVLRYGSHVRICVQETSGWQWEVGLGISGIERRTINGRRAPDQDVTSLRGGIPTSILNGTKENHEKLREILTGIIRREASVNAIHNRAKIVGELPMKQRQYEYDFGATNCEGFIIQVLQMAGFPVGESLDLVGSFALRYKSNGEAYGEAMPSTDNLR